MTTIEQPSTGLDALRLTADAMVAGYAGKRRPSWAPALVLEGELLSLLRSVNWIKEDGKPVARLWARFTDPRRGPVRCMGFELRAGEARSGVCFFESMREASGAWRNGPCWCEPMPPRSYGIYDEARHLEAIAKEREAYAQAQREMCRQGRSEAEYDDAWESELSASKELDAELRKMGVFRLRTPEQIRKEHQDYELARERHRKLSRITELGAARVADFAGRSGEEMRLGALMTKACSCCGRALTDPVSLERGIGPECWSFAQYLQSIFERNAEGDSAC